MIRKMLHDDIETVGDIWLAASIQSHDFVSEEFWRADLKTMTTEILPHPKIDAYVFETKGEIKGFISLGGDHVGCLFVKPENQNQGIGKVLLNYVKALHSRLDLTVFKKNVDATRFYKREGFQIQGEGSCRYTGCEEFKMRWQRSIEQTTPVDRG